MKKIIKFVMVLGLIFSFAPQFANAATFEEKSQDVTAYTASQYKTDGKARLNASGKAPRIGDVAVKRSSGLPFGTIVLTSSPITVDGYLRESFAVQDWGIDPELSTYAIDIWFGFCRTNAFTGTDATLLGCSPSDVKVQSAFRFGQNKMDLTFYTRQNLVLDNLNSDDSSPGSMDLDVSNSNDSVLGNIDLESLN
ncbi:hypothetical protein QWT69_16510 [Sporosarcina oncorhynchi]|uniref:Uncharacterized protein n=1 Tax=Sporosarcina oncorhynchi TaxID=3056444 RepID=A0ABZ0L4A9_9BACL|nr:hypothetical protein [Sporosarcina sp. T2O-4]WOV87430.1 hypothetical protein QWT69_16510 [Sporosarcina sp. T2O-4]